MADPFTQLAIFSAASGALLGSETAAITVGGILASYGISLSPLGIWTGLGTSTLGTFGTTVGTVGTTSLAGTVGTVGTTALASTASSTVTTAATIALGPMIGIGLAVLGTGIGAKYLYDRSQKRKQALMKVCRFIGVAEEKIKEHTKELKSYISQKLYLSKKILIEERKLQNHQFKEEILEGNRVFMVIGESGTGKSTLCNRLLGDKSEEGDKGFYVSHSDRGTSKLSKKTFKNNTQYFTIVDTPGCNDKDGEEKDNEYMNNIIGYLNGCGGVNAFLLVVSLAETRIKGSLIRLWKQYQERFGKEFWKFSILVLTNLDSVNKRKQNSRKQNCFDELKQKFGVSIKANFIMIGHDNYEEAIKELFTKYSKEKFVKNNLKALLHDLIKKEKKLSNLISGRQELITAYREWIEKLTKRKKELL